MSIVDLEYSMTNFGFLMPKLIGDGEFHFQKRNLSVFSVILHFCNRIWNFSVEIQISKRNLTFLVSNFIFF